MPVGATVQTQVPPAGFPPLSEQQLHPARGFRQRCPGEAGPREGLQGRLSPAQGPSVVLLSSAPQTPGPRSAQNQREGALGR